MATKVTQHVDYPINKNRTTGSSESKAIFLAVVASLLMTSLVCVFLTMVFFKPAIIFNFGFISKYFLTNPDQLSNSNNLKSLLPLISNGTVMSINDLWNFQNSLYQTIISVLIGLNAVLATLSFFMIKNSSSNAAREEAIKEVERHIVSQQFNRSVKKSIHKKLKATEIDFVDLQDLMSQMQSEIKNNKIELDKFKTEKTTSEKDIQQLRSQIRIISETIAKEDQSESGFEGGLTLHNGDKYGVHP